MKTLNAILLVGGLAYSLSVPAQKLADIKAKYPGEEAVMLNNNIAYRIKIEDGQPQVESQNVRRLLFLSDHTSAYMSRYGFTHSSFHKVIHYQAYTRTADNKKVKVTDFKTTDSDDESVFYDDVKQTLFDFPALGPGAIGTLELTEKHTDAHMLTPFYFSRPMPVLHAELKISFPKDMSVRYIIKGNQKDKIEFSEESRRGEITYTFSADNLDPEKSYEDAPENPYYYTHVIFFIERYKNEKGESVSYLSNLDDLYKMDYDFISKINHQVGPQLRHVVDSLTSGLSSTEQKARAIYAWVQGHIKYVAFEAGLEGFVPRDANLVCARRYGDCKDMSSILTCMLNYAGVPAYYTWIGTRHLPYDYTEVPTPIVDNHMICTIKLRDRYIFLDGTDPTCIFGTPSEMIQGKQALISINEKEYKVLRVPVPEKEKNTLTDTTYLELTDKGLKGSIAINLTGYYAMNTRGALTYVTAKNKEDYFKDRLNRGSNKFRLEDYDVSHLADKNSVRLTGDFDLEDYAKHIGSDWYVNLNLFKLYEHEEIDYPKRRIPIEFPYRFEKKYVTVLKIPDGFRVSYLPESRSFHNDTWGFRMQYEQKNNQVILTQEFDNDQMMLYPDKFQEWNKVLEHLFPLYKESISLTKK